MDEIDPLTVRRPDEIVVVKTLLRHEYLARLHASGVGQKNGIAISLMTALAFWTSKYWVH